MLWVGQFEPAGPDLQIKHPEIERCKTRQGRQEQDQHGRVHVHLPLRIQERLGVQARQNAGHNEQKKRHGRGGDDGVDGGQRGPFLLNFHRRPEREVRSINQQENEDGGFTGVPIPEGSPAEFGPDCAGHGGQEAEKEPQPRRRSGFDVSYRVPYIRKWLTVYTDSFCDDDVSPLSAPQRCAWNPGFYLSHIPKLSKLDFRAEGITTDQRGVLRGASPDIGAYERGPATAISAAGGATQSTQINSAFPTPRQVEITDILGGRLDAVNVTFAGPSTGAGIASGGTVATNSNGIATFSATANSAAGGPYTVTATAGALSAPFSLTNNPYSTTTTITSHLLNPSHAGQSVTVTFAVTSPGGTPAGSVTVSDGTFTCTGMIAAGSCAIVLPTPGTHTLTATYNGNSSFAGSTSTAVSHTVTGWFLHLPLVIR